MSNAQLSKKPAVQDITECCPGCGGEAWNDFFVSQRVPVDVGSALSSEEEALGAPLADIALAYCYSCGLVWNRMFDNSCISFRPGYEAGLHHSPLVRSTVDAMVERLIKRFELRGKNIIEIGCGSGYFLRRLCERGGNLGTGIDPTVSQAGTEQVGTGRVQFIRDFYSRRYHELPCDFLCCQSVLEDIPNPLAFLTDVNRMSRQANFDAYFEVFNGGRAFEKNETWSIHYEQCNYYSLHSFRNLLERSGFQILDAGTCSGNEQYIFVEAKTSNGHTSKIVQLSGENEQLPSTLAEFSACHSKNVAKWNDALAVARKKGQSIVLWGSGGKGVSFLNAMGKGSGIRFVVDINPARQGKYVPGTAQQIVPPDFLAEHQPDVVILSNQAYESEIRQQIAGMGLHPEYWYA